MKKTRFFIFGQSRSGSGLLVDLLNSHPEIYCERELLNRNSIRNKDKFRRLLIERFPYFYIEHQINKEQEKIFGFKLLIHQFLNYPQIKQKLFNEKWKIIHLQRKDVLAQTLSGLIAGKTGEYHRHHQDKLPDNKTFTIDPKMVENKLNYRIKASNQELELLNGLNYHDVVYENELVNDYKWHETMEGVFKYLGVPVVEVSATTLKTDSRINEERISNYLEILDYLKSTGFDHIIKQYG